MGPDDPSPKLPTTRTERLALAFGYMALIGLFTAEIFDHFTPSKLSILFMALAWGPLLVLHELGHAFMARLVGWRLSEISIGFGRELWRFNYKGCRIRVRATPIEGYVLPSPNSLDRVRAKSALVYAAGPGAEILLIGLLWLGWGDALLSPAGDDLVLIAAQSVALAAAIGALFNLLPFTSGGGASDGLGIITSLLANPASFSSRLSRPFVLEGQRALYLERAELAREWVQRGLAQYPDDPQLRALSAVVRAAEGSPEQGLEGMEALGHPDDYSPAIRNELLANAAWVVLLGQQRHLLPDAVRACERVLEKDAEHVRTRLLHGWLLEERGMPDAAYAELMTGYRYARDAEEEDQFVARLALLAKALDKPAVAARFSTAAERAALGPTLQRRLQQTFNP